MVDYDVELRGATATTSCFRPETLVTMIEFPIPTIDRRGRVQEILEDVRIVVYNWRRRNYINTWIMRRSVVWHYHKKPPIKQTHIV